MNRLLVLAIAVTALLTACPPTVECPPGEVADDTGTCVPCPAGTFSTSGVCAPCPIDQTSDAGDDSCEPCPAGTEPSVDRDACLLCPAGEFAPSGSIECLRCPFGSVTSVEGSPSCEVCVDGFRANASGTACEPCPAGTFGRDGTCTACPVDQVASGGGDSSCDPCPAGTEPNLARDECLPCNAGEFAPPGSVECIACPFGAVTTRTGAPSCDVCPDGFRANGSRTTCEPCPAGTFGQGGTCTTCPANEIADGSGDGSCEPCPAGAEPNANQDGCVACNAGEFAPSGSAECIACPFGAVTPSAGTPSCDACPDGFRANESRTACEACPAGTFGRNGTCTTCPIDQVSNGGDRDCDPCRAGTEPNANQDECILCDAGEFAPFGSVECVRCPFGTVATEAGSAACEACPSGLAPDFNRTSCVPCPTGQYAVDGTCVRCPAGTVVDDTQTSCEACDAGTAPNETRDACEPCAAGTFAPDTWFDACLACPAGSVSAPGALECTPCPPGEVPAADGATCEDPAPPVDVDARCTLDPVAVQELSTSTTDVFYDGGRDVFIAAQQTPGIERLDPTTFAVTRLADAPEAMGRVFRFKDRVLAVRLNDFVSDPDRIVDAPLDLQDPRGATVHAVREIPGVGSNQVKVTSIVPVGATGLAYNDVFSGVVTLLDTATVPFTHRFSTTPASRFLVDLVGIDKVTVLATASLNGTFTITAFDGTSDAPWQDGFQTAIVSHTLSGIVQTMAFDETHGVVYATTLPGSDPASVSGLLMIDIGNPAAPIRRQPIEPEFPRRNGPLSRPVFVEDFVVVVNQDIDDHARATVFERKTLRRVGFLVDENFVPASGSDLFVAATPTASRGTKVFVGAGVGLLRDFVFDVGPCVSP